MKLLIPILTLFVQLPGIQKYLDTEPGVEIDVDAEMEKTKDERDEEAALRKKDHASFRSLMKGNFLVLFSEERLSVHLALVPV